MSYLPRMSKTYKEPEEQIYEDPTKEITFNSIPVASALPDEKGYNPESVLKQYSFLPHPPPRLPGPSLIEEAEQNERANDEARRRRTKDNGKSEGADAKCFSNEAILSRVLPVANVSLANKPTGSNPEGREPHPTNGGATKVPVKNVSSGTDKGSEGFSDLCGFISRSIVEHNEVGTTERERQKREAEERGRETRDASPAVREGTGTANMCPRDFEKPKGVTTPYSLGKDQKPETKPRGASGAAAGTPSILSCGGVSMEGVDEGVQCVPNGNAEKTFVMPLSVHCLITTLSFLVRELNESEGETSCGQTREAKKLVSHIDATIAALTNRKTDPRFALQTSNSDSKRLENVFKDLEQYVKQVYGENGKLGYRSEEKKRIYCKLFQKEYELRVLNEKLRESEIQNPSVRITDMMTISPEVTLQNKDLENEQLLAEIQFNSQELTRYQEALAERHWDIKNSKEEITELKKKLAALKSKTKT